MTNLLTRLLDTGGLWLLHLAMTLVLQVLFVLSVGLIALTCAVQASYLLIVDKAYRKDLFAHGFAKRKQ